MLHNPWLHPKTERDGSLTEKNIYIIQQLANGATQLEVAQDLNLELSTVKYHLEASHKKMKAKNTTNLVAICMREGLIE